MSRSLGRLVTVSTFSAALLLSGAPDGGQSLVAGTAGTDPPPWVWRQIGPAPIRVDNPTSAFFGEGEGGVVYDIAIDPRGITDEVIYLATNGGIWKSADGGAHWFPKTDAMPSNSTGAVALDPDAPDTVYAGTGTLIDPLGINFKAVGLYKSEDGGDTWRVLGEKVFGAAGDCAATRDNKCGLGISRIVVLPGAPDVVLVGTRSGLFRSTDGGETWGSNSPAFDNGKPILPGWVTDLDVDTRTPTTIYASVNRVGIFRSVDAGATFTRNLFIRPGAPTSGTFGSLAFAQSTAQGTVPNNRVLYVNVATSSSCGSGTCAGIWKSIDGGRNWFRALAAGLGPCQRFCGVDQTIGVDPVDPTIVHVGLIDYWVSGNGAYSFGREAVGHVDQVAMAFSPPAHYRAGLPASPVWVGNHGGVWTGVPRERVCLPVFGCRYAFAWHSKNEGLANLGIVSVDFGRGSAANNGFSYAGVWDNGLMSKRPTDPGTDWHLGVGGDGGFVAVDPNNPLRAYANRNNDFLATDSAGLRWTVPLEPIPDVVFRVAIDPSSREATSPFTSQRLYALAGPGLYRTTDAGRSFTRIVSWVGASPPNPVAIAISASDPNIVWLGMSDGSLVWTDDAFATVQPTVFTGAPARPVTSVAINPDDPTEVVVGYGPDPTVTPTLQPIWLTTDSGQTWSDIRGNLPAVPVNSVLIDPSTSPASIIAANDLGVMYATDSSASGATWFALGTGLPTVYSLQLAHDPTAVPELLRVGTYGRSVFELSGPVTDLRVDLHHDPEPVLGGETMTYELFVTNQGGERAFGVVAALELDSNLTFVSAGGGCSAPSTGSNLVTCRAPNLSPDGSGSVRFDVVVRVKCPPDFVTSRASVGSLLLSDSIPVQNRAEDTAHLFCGLDTSILSAVDGDGLDVPYFGKTPSTFIKFTLTGSEGTAGFECSLAQANFTPCTSPKSYDNLIPGEHDFQVQAVDANGNRDPTPATHIWTVL